MRAKKQMGLWTKQDDSEEELGYVSVGSAFVAVTTCSS